MKIRYTMLSVLMGATLFASAPLLANADALVVEPVVAETFFVTTYLNGGVGNSEEALMHRIAHEFPLRLTFSERKDGEFIVNVPVVIFDAKGNPVFELPNAGPMLYVILPDGKYKVSARYKGLTESQEIVLGGKAGKDLYFHWNNMKK